MARKEHIARYTAKALAANRKASRSNWEKAAAVTNDELETSIAADGDEAGMVIDWNSVTVISTRSAVIYDASASNRRPHLRKIRTRWLFLR
jgi:hypothetical protein